MEKYIDIITLINQYLNNELSVSARADFTNRLESDTEFNTAYQEQLIFLGGLERVQLKNEIAKARSGYVKAKWIKGILISVLVVVVGITAYQFTQNKEQETPKQPEVETVIGVLEDSLTVSEEKQEIAVEVVDSSQAKNEIISSEKPEIIKQAESEIDSLLAFEAPLETETVTTEKASFNPIRKTPLTISIITEKEITVIGQEGTKLTFKKHSFINKKTGKLVRGKVNLKLAEYYKLSDIVLADLTTTSNDKMLETGGMLYIEAEKDGQELMLDPKKPMRIEFPKKQRKEGMQLFLGEEGEDGINWVLDTSLESEIDSLLPSEPQAILLEEFEQVDVPFAVIEQVPVFPGCEDVVSAQQRECFQSKIQSFITTNLNTKLAESLGLSGRQRVYVNFVIDTTGSIQRIRSRGDHPILTQEAERVIGSLPRIAPGLQRGRAVNVPFSIPIDFNLNNSNVILGPDKRFRKRKSDSINRAKFQASIERKEASRLSNPEINAYIFSGTKLGWINCDRFRTTNRRMIVKIKEADGSKIKLIFKNIRSVLPGKVLSNAVDFGSVPSNTPALLFALKKIDGKFYMATKEITTAKGLELDLDFKEMSLKQLREAVEKATE